MGPGGHWQRSDKAAAPQAQRVLASLPAPGLRLCLADALLQVYNVEAPASAQASLPLHVDVDMGRVMEVFLAQLR